MKYSTGSYSETEPYKKGNDVTNQRQRSVNEEDHMTVERNEEKKRHRSAEWLQSIQKEIEGSRLMTLWIRNVSCLVLMMTQTCGNQPGAVPCPSVETTGKGNRCRKTTKRKGKREAKITNDCDTPPQKTCTCMHGLGFLQVQVWVGPLTPMG